MTGLISPALDGFLAFGLGSSAATLADDLADAVEAHLSAALVPGWLTWVGAGKAPPGTRQPYARVGDLDEDADYDGLDAHSAPYDDTGAFPILVLASTDAQAKALGKLVAAALNDAPLRFADGELLQIRRGPRGAPVLDPSPAPGGEACWVVHLIFRTICSRTL